VSTEYALASAGASNMAEPAAIAAVAAAARNRFR
jgi:hypothetical protein